MTAATTSSIIAETKPAAMNIAYFITQALQRSLGYAERVFNDIPADKFASSVIVNANHPAFVAGHLLLYPNRIFTLVGRKDLVVDHGPWQELFQAGAPCLNDASKYPSKDALRKVFFDGYRKVVEVLPQVGDETMRQDNPIEGRMREIFPRIGIAVTFMCTSHLMMHLGQVSTWRRAAGLGPAM